MMEVSDLIKKVRKIELKTKKQSFELFSGNYKSTFKGRGMSFAEVRAYSFGDDVRSIDWNVTSRSQEPYIKEFEEERELTFLIMVDVSRSMEVGSSDTSKRDIVTELAATIAFSALRNNDKVGVLFFSEKVEKYIPPKKGKGHVLTIIRELIEVSSTHQKTNVAEALRFLQNTLKKKSVVFLISDFIESPSYEKEVSIASTRHQFYGIHVYDQSEQNSAPIGLAQLFNAETNSFQWVDTNSSSFKKELKVRFEKNIDNQKKQFEKIGNAFASLDIQEPYLPKLHRLFSK